MHSLLYRCDLTAPPERVNGILKVGEEVGRSEVRMCAVAS